MLAKRTGKGRVAIANPEVERELALLQSRSGSPAAVQALAAAIEERDNYTHEHSERGRPALPRRRDDARPRRRRTSSGSPTPRSCTTSASSRCPPSCCARTARSTADEWEVMSEHPIVGERILARTKELAAIAPIVRHEHEHWDGTRLPRRPRAPAHPGRLARDPRLPRLRRDDRPRGPTGQALPVDDAVAELRAGAGSKFDPDVVDALLDLLGHNAPQVPDRAAGVKLARRAAARTYRPAVSAGLGTGRVTSVAE